MKLFRLLNFRSLKKQWILVLLNILSFFVSISMLSAIFMLNESKYSFAKDEGYRLNRGDMSLYSINFNDVYYTKEDRILGDNFDQWFYEYLLNRSDVHFTYEHNALGGLEAECFIRPDETTYPPLFCFIDFEEIGRYMPGINPQNVSKDTVFISQYAASRMHVQAGDSLNFSREIGQPVTSYPIVGIYPDIGLNYDLFGTIYGTALIDMSKIPELLGKDPGIPKERFNPDLITLFYIDAPYETLQQIETDARVYAKQIGFNIPLHITYSNDMMGAVNEATNLYNLVLCFFTMICIVTSAFTIFQLLQLRIFNRQKEIALLKILGQKNYQNSLYIILELLICVIPALIFGIITSYVIIHPISKEIPLYNIEYFGIKEWIVSTGKVIGSIFALIASISIPTLYFINGRNIQDILRKQDIPILQKNQICIIIFINILCLMVLFSFFIGIILSVMLIAGIGVIFAIIALICKLFLLCLKLVKVQSIFLIASRYIQRNNSRVFFTIIISTICLTLFLSAATVGFTTTSQAEATILKDYGYNFQSIVSARMDDKFHEFLEQNNITYEYSYAIRDVTIKDYIKDKPSKKIKKSYPLYIYYQIPQKDVLEPLKDGAIMGLSVSSTYRKYAGSTLTMDIDNHVFEVPVSGRGKIRFKPSNSEIALFVDDLPDPSLGEGLTKSYFFDIPKETQRLIQDFVSEQRGILALNAAEEVRQNMMLLSKFYYLFSMFIIFFLVSIIILVLCCALINYGNRTKEFCVYEAYGAAKSTVIKIILLENGILAFVSSFISIVLAYPIVFVFSLFISGFIAKVDLPFAIATALIAFLIQLLSSILVMNSIKFHSVLSILRSGDEGE